MTSTRKMSGDVKDLEKFKGCFDSNDDHKKSDSLEWQYLQPPVNKVYVNFESEEVDGKEKIAAIYAVFPVKFKVGNAVATGTQSLDTITDIDYRGKGLFIKLARDVYNWCTEEKVKLVYGFPNGNSIHGFVSKLGWHNLDPVPFLILPLRSRYFLNKTNRKILAAFPDVRLPRLSPVLIPGKNKKISPITRFDDNATALWKKFSSGIHAAVDRDKDYMNWRYISKPHENYHIAGYYEDGRLEGYIIYVTKEKHGGKIGYVMELVYDPAKKSVGKQLMNYAVSAFRADKADAVLAWCFSHSPNYKTYRTAGFFTLPEKLRPIELHFGFREFNLDEQELAVVKNRSSWYLSYSDSDTV